MKVFFTFLMGCFFALSLGKADAQTVAAQQAVVRILGDVNRDVLVNISDALIVATYGLDSTIAVPNGGEIALGDVNRDGRINVSDALIIATYGVDSTHAGLPEGIGKPVDGSPPPVVTPPPVEPEPEINFSPVLTSPGIHVAPVTLPFTLPLSAQDPDGDVLTFAVDNPPEGAVLVDQALQWTPNFEQRGNYEITFSVTDGRGGVGQGVADVVVTDFDFLMRRYFMETALPSFINLIFQVTDRQGRGIDNLTQDRFEVLENNQPLSPTESALFIEHLSAVNHELKTVLVLDNSASIENDLEQVKAAAIALVENVAPQQEFAIYEFSERPTLLQDFTADPVLLTDAIRRIQPGLPTTNLYGAVIEGLQRWQDTFSLDGIHQGFLIVLTDGRDTQAFQTIEQVLFLRSAKRIYTVGLGNEIDPAVLREMGNAGFFQIQDVEELADRFKLIQSDITTSARGFYSLQYLSPTRGERLQQLRVVVRNNKSRSHLNESFVSTGFYSVRKGVHINTSPILPEGIDSLLLSVGDSVALNATTFLGANRPEYMWDLSDDQSVSLVLDPQDDARAQLLVKGNNPPNVTVTVSDVANDLYRILPIEVMQTPDTLVVLPGGALMEMVSIQPGTFNMGSILGDADELPVHRVTLRNGYYLGKFEVTQHQWQSVMETEPWAGRSSVVVDSLSPAAYVSWHDAQDFVEKLNADAGRALYRLPTEAEWEYACRAGTQTAWSFGDDESQLGNFAWFVGNAWLQNERYGHQVGTRLANPWRLFDMHGNVMEWCHDGYASTYGSGDRVDPSNGSSGLGRVIRGGCFECSADRTRSADRHFSDPNTRSHVIGFRIVRLGP